MEFTIASSPDVVMNAFEDEAGLIVLNIVDVKSLVVSTTVGTDIFIKNYVASELLDGTFNVDISRYVQGFVFQPEHIYVNNCQQKSYISDIIIPYSVVMTATFEDDTTSQLTFNGKSIAGI